MALDDWIDSAPSVLGAAFTGYSCFAFPAAIPLALLQGTVISDPAQMVHAGDGHNTQAGWADAAKAQIDQAVAKVSTAWDGNDKEAFDQTYVQSYKQACDETAKMCRAAADSLKTLGGVFMDAGVISFAIGGVMLAYAVAMAGTWWLPGANVAVETAGTATAEVSSGVMRALLGRVAMLVAKAATLLRSIKAALALAVVGFVGAKTEASTLSTGKDALVAWPDVSPAATPGTP
jgi:uncharacterized protein YukE